MALEHTYDSYIGLGKIHARAAGTTGKYRHVGNCSVLTLKQALDVKRQPDYTRPGGGTLKKVERIEAVTVDLTMLSLNTENWALALAGDSTAVPAGSATDEVVKLYKGSFARLAFPPSEIDAVTDAAGTTTYAEGTDYEISTGGLWIPDGSTITEGAAAKVDYSYPAHDRIEAATKTASVMEVVFEGLNEAESNAPMVVDIWRLSVPSASEVALIGADMGQFAFSCEALKDSTKGAGLSAYLRAQKVTPAAA